MLPVQIISSIPGGRSERSFSQPKSSVKPRAIRSKNGLPLGLGLSLGLALTAPAFSQSVRPESAPTSEPVQVAALDRDVIQLAKFEVTDSGVFSDKSIIPNRPVRSVYGFDTSVQDTPRSIVQVTPDQLKNDIITTGQEIARYAPGLSYNYNNGRASAPYIRGQTPDQYQNGIRALRGGTNVPYSNNAIDRLDIVGGPASSIFGPSVNTAGYVNYISKRPFFDKTRGQVTLEFGDWRVDDQSSQDFKQTLDFGGPLGGDKLAYRVSLQGREGEPFYGTADPRTTNGQNHFNSYFALTWLPNERVIVETNVALNNYDYATSRGFNRVTQDLIDNGNYLTGIATPILRRGNTFFAPVVNPAGRTDANPTGLLADADPNTAGLQYRQVLLNGPIGGTRSVTVTNNLITPGITSGAAPGSQTTAAIVGYVFEPQNFTTRQIKQNRSYTYGDVNHTKQFIGLNTISLKVSDDVQVRNSAYIEAIDARSSQLFETTGTINQDFLVDDRIEVLARKPLRLFGREIGWQSNSGVEFRYNRLKSYGMTLPYTDASDLFDPRSITSFGVYGISLYDAIATQTVPRTRNPTTGAYTNNAYLNTAFGDVTTPARQTPYPIPGEPDYRTNPASATLHETLQSGLFTQHEFAFGEKVLWTIGGRITVFSVEATGPLIPFTGEQTFSDRTSPVLPSGNTSLVYKVTPEISTYATYSYTQAAADTPALTNDQLGNDQFRQAAYLYELGAKFEVIPNKLFSSLAIYEQTRSSTAFIDSTTNQTITPRLKVRGLEASLQYQPNRNFSLNTNLTLFRGRNIDTTITSNKSEGANVSVGELTSAGVVAIINQDQGNAAFSQASKLPGAGNKPYSLVPDYQVNIVPFYQFDNGFGIGAAFWVWGPWDYFLYADIEIPTQYNLDLTFSYGPPKGNWGRQGRRHQRHRRVEFPAQRRR
ncbi:MAG: TonB-dependent receptor [Nibricoccus sp.]